MEKDCCTATVESNDRSKLVLDGKTPGTKKQEPIRLPRIVDPHKQLLEDLRLEQSELH